MTLQESTPLLSITEFAARLRVTKACVRRWLLERKITHVKLGRLVRIEASEADRLISEGLRLAHSAKDVPAALRTLFEQAKKMPDRRRDIDREEVSATRRKAK